jgi:hypothetical protein
VEAVQVRPDTPFGGVRLPTAKTEEQIRLENLKHLGNLLTSHAVCAVTLLAADVILLAVEDLKAPRVLWVTVISLIVALISGVVDLIIGTCRVAWGESKLRWNVWHSDRLGKFFQRIEFTSKIIVVGAFACGGVRFAEVLLRNLNSLI